jgi:hypothetical protein
MSFPEKIRQFFLDSQDNECQYTWYDDKRGWVKCKSRKNLHVHHITPEGWTATRGGNPDEEDGLVLCQSHHVKNPSNEEHTKDFSFHPDMAQAYKNYGEWKRQFNHLELIKERRLDKKDYPSPFDDAVALHREKAQRGERYHAGTPEIDEYYREISKEKALKYKLKGNPKPRPERRTVRFKKKPNNWEWAKDLYDK